jgi:hypothetical protein
MSNKIKYLIKIYKLNSFVMLDFQVLLLHLMRYLVKLKWFQVIMEIMHHLFTSHKK